MESHAINSLAPARNVVEAGLNGAIQNCSDRLADVLAHSPPKEGFGRDKMCFLITETDRELVKDAAQMDVAFAHAILVGLDIEFEQAAV